MGDSIEGSSEAARSAQQVDRQNTDEQKKTTHWLKRLFRSKSSPRQQDEWQTNRAERDMIPRVPDLLELSYKPVEDVAIPKADIISVSDDISKDGLLDVFRDSGLTRLPVYKETLDKPVGMTHLKDFALKYGFSSDDDAFDMNELLRPLLFVPPSMPIGVLFQKMQNDRRHMALVIDEYGGVEGLVTIEDLIEQVFGEIEDEHDVEDDLYWSNPKSNVYLALAKTPLDEFEEEIGFSLTEVDSVDEEEIDTLGGLLFMMVGRVPVRGEVVEHPTGAVFDVIEADSRRIKRVRVTIPEILNVDN